MFVVITAAGDPAGGAAGDPAGGTAGGTAGDSATASAGGMDDLRSLEVRCTGVRDDAAQDALARSGLGLLAGDHAWLEVAALRAHGPSGPSWAADFDAMLAYAAAHGWCSTDGARVRAHVVRS